MSENEKPEGLGAIILAAAAGLPAAISKSALGALNRLVAGVADIPAAHLAGWKERVEDSNYERRKFRRELVDAAVAKATENSDLVDRTLDRLLLEQSRKQANREAIAREAASQLCSVGPSGPINGEHDVDDDWMNQFIRFSEDASSERLRILFGKILAGEIVNPGTFSPTTLRAVSEMTQSLAQDFQWIWGKRIDSEVWKGPEFSRGEAWQRLTRLRDAGFLSPVDAGIHQPQFNAIPAFGGLSVWRLAAGDNSSLTIAMNAAVSAWLPIVNFTAVGLELGGLLPTPDYEANLRAVATGFPKRGVAWIKFAHGPTLGETIWSESQDQAESSS